MPALKPLQANPEYKGKQNRLQNYIRGTIMRYVKHEPYTNPCVESNGYLHTECLRNTNYGR
jgi:hypothetical protein